MNVGLGPFEEREIVRFTRSAAKTPSLQLHLDLTCQVRQSCQLCRLSRVSKAGPSQLRVPYARCSFLFRVALEKRRVSSVALLSREAEADQFCSLIGRVSSVSLPLHFFLRSIRHFFLFGRCVDLNLLPASDGRPKVLRACSKNSGAWGRVRVAYL